MTKFLSEISSKNSKAGSNNQSLTLPDKAPKYEEFEYKNYIVTQKKLEIGLILNKIERVE